MGIDVGSVSTDLVIMDTELKLRDELYLRTQGNPIEAVRQGLSALAQKYEDEEIWGVGCTGSGRSLAGAIAGADVIKNEITAHAAAAAQVLPEVRTVIEIGGQDSKLILMKDGLVTDFAMNTVCAAGTGSFLDRQAERLGLEVGELGGYALRGKNPIRVAGRCAVFAESDLIHKQQLGCSREDIIAGMCDALVRNYIGNVAKGKKLLPPILFQGGVAANDGIRAAFERELGASVQVPRYHKVMGAYGAALLANKKMPAAEDRHTGFKGFGAAIPKITSESFNCGECPNGCEVVRLFAGDSCIGAFSDRCGRYQPLSV